MTPLLVLLAACWWSEVEGPTDGPVEPEVPVEGDPAFLVWAAARPLDAATGLPGPLQLTTRWVVLRPSGPEVRGTTSGILAAGVGGLARIDVARAELPGTACDGTAFTHRVADLVWTPLAGGEPRVVDPLVFPADTPPGERFEWTEDVTVDGQVGPYLFVRGQAVDHGCGAHPNTLARSRVIDVATGAEAPLLDDVTLRPVLDAARASLLASLARPGADGTPRGEAARPEDLEIARLVPRWTPEKLVLAVQVTAPTCYACSDGQWSSYTVSETVDLLEVSPALLPWAVPPAWPPELGPIDGWSDVRGVDEAVLAAAFAPPVAPVAPAE